MDKNKLMEIIGTEFDASKVKNLTEPVETKNEVFQDKENEEKFPTGMWAVHGSGNVFTPCENTVKILPPGIYSAYQPMGGPIHFIKKKVISDEIIKLPDDSSEEVLQHIEEFRSLKSRFEEMKYIYKRGILLYGPQGSGKTITVLQTVRNFVEDGGIALLGNYPGTDSKALHLIREFEQERPLMCIYEDIDDTIYYYGDRDLTMLLDGEDNIDNILFLATTNYPERLPPRLLNRPSRFDIVQFIGLPGKEARRAYLKAKTDMSLTEINTWVGKTDGLSIPHLKELIILVKVYKKSLDNSIEKLKSMSKLPHSSTFTERFQRRSYDINVTIPKQEAPEIDLSDLKQALENLPAPIVHVEPAQVPQPIINIITPGQKPVKKTVTKRDEKGRTAEIIETPINIDGD